MLMPENFENLSTDARTQFFEREMILFSLQQKIHHGVATNILDLG
jgi:hypothetical protein